MSDDSALLSSVLAAKSHYEALGVSRSASYETIRNEYKRRALQYHPDKNPDPNAHQAFIRISEAFATLKDEQERRIYNQSLEEQERSAFRYGYEATATASQYDAEETGEHNYGVFGTHFGVNKNDLYDDYPASSSSSSSSSPSPDAAGEMPNYQFYKRGSSSATTTSTSTSIPTSVGNRYQQPQKYRQQQQGQQQGQQQQAQRRLIIRSSATGNEAELRAQLSKWKMQWQSEVMAERKVLEEKESNWYAANSAKVADKYGAVLGRRSSVDIFNDLKAGKILGYVMTNQPFSSSSSSESELRRSRNGDLCSNEATRGGATRAPTSSAAASASGVGSAYQSGSHPSNSAIHASTSAMQGSTASSSTFSAYASSFRSGAGQPAYGRRSSQPASFATSSFSQQQHQLPSQHRTTAGSSSSFTSALVSTASTPTSSQLIPSPASSQQQAQQLQLFADAAPLTRQETETLMLGERFRVKQPGNASASFASSVGGVYVSLWCSADMEQLQWRICKAGSSGQPDGIIKAYDIVNISVLKKPDSGKWFAILTANNTLTLEASSVEMRTMWVALLRRLKALAAAKHKHDAG